MSVQFNRIGSGAMLVLACLTVVGCASHTASGSSTAGAQAITNQASAVGSAGNPQNQPGTNGLTDGTNNATNPAQAGAKNAVQTGSGPAHLNTNASVAQAVVAPVAFRINGKQVTPRNPIKQIGDSWLVSTDDLDLIFNTYIDTWNPKQVEVNLASIVKLVFDLEKPVVTINDTAKALPAGAVRDGKLVYLPIQTIADQCGVAVQFDPNQNQLVMDAAALRFQLPLIGGQSLQTVVMPNGDPAQPAQIKNEQGQVLLSTNEPGPIIGLQYADVGAHSPLVLLISQGGSGGRIYTAYLYNANTNQFQKVTWGASETFALGGVSYHADTKLISLSARTYDAVNHSITTLYKWLADAGSSVGHLEPVSSSFGPVISSNQVPHEPQLLLSAALSSVAEHLPEETPLYFANQADGAAFYNKWEPVFPFGDTVSVDLSKWSEQAAANGSLQTVQVTATGDNGEKTTYSCTVQFQMQGTNARIQSIALTPFSH